MSPRAFAAALLALGLACNPRLTRTRPADSRDLQGVIFMPFSSSQVEGFFDAKGRPCAPFRGEIHQSFAGWQSPDQDPICDHDTLDDGANAATLELRWLGSVPADGAYDLISGGYAVGAWGRVTSRGSYYGDYFAQVRLVLEVRSRHCRVERSFDLAKAQVAGFDVRAAEFKGWLTIPDTRLAGCARGDPLEVRLRLVGDANRGRIEVDAFGFSVASAGELDRMFGVRPAPVTAAAAR